MTASWIWAREILQRGTNSMTKEQKILVKRINYYCDKKGYSYYTLAYEASIPFSTLMHIVKGTSKNPGIFNILKICEGLDVSPAEFFDTEDFRNMP